MNILFDHQIFSQQPYGGISRYFYEIANLIAAVEGNEVEIIAPLYLNEYFRNDCKVRPRGIKIPWLTHPCFRLCSAGCPGERRGSHWGKGVLSLPT